jgi:hypothetical protein
MIKKPKCLSDAALTGTAKNSIGSSKFIEIYEEKNRTSTPTSQEISNDEKMEQTNTYFLLGLDRPENLGEVLRCGQFWRKRIG